MFEIPQSLRSRGMTRGDLPAGTDLPSLQQRIAFAGRRHCCENGSLRFGREDKRTNSEEVARGW